MADAFSHDEQQSLESLLVRKRRRRPLVVGLSLLFGLGAVAALGWFAWTAGLFVQQNLLLEDDKADVVDRRLAEARVISVKGINDEGRPYALRARLSQRPDANRNLIFLDEVSGEITREGGGVLKIRSRRATYNSETKVADLEGKVRIESPGRYVISMEKGRLFASDNTMESASPVRMTLSGGEIRARSMRTFKGGKVVFSGQVHAIFDKPESRADEAAPAGAANTTAPEGRAEGEGTDQEEGARGAPATEPRPPAPEKGEADGQQP